MQKHRLTRALLLLLLLSSVALAGCASYRLQGVVVEGNRPGVYVVDSSDPRLKQTAVADARVLATLDPDKLRSKPLAPVMTDDHGRFTIPVDDPGAGLLEYTVTLYCDADGYGDPPSEVMPLPGMGKQILVVLSAGRRKGPSKKTPSEDILGEVEKFQKQFE